MTRSAIMTAAVAGTTTALAGPLELTINLTEQTFDWVEGTNIARTDGSMDNNRFGANVLINTVRITGPLAAYAGAGEHNATIFEISNDGTTIEAIGLGTTAAPGLGATFSGDAVAPAVAIYEVGSFADFSNLTLGSYVLAPNGPWNDGILVNVVPAPAGAAVLLGSLPLIARRRR